jgi:hypothetical protein
MVRNMRTLIAIALIVLAAVHTTSAQEDWEIRSRIRGEGVHIRIGRNYVLPQDQVATRPVIVIGASATIDGRMDGDLVVVGGQVRIGPTAQVRGDVVSMGGNVIVADAAQIAGEVKDVSIFWPDLRVAIGDLWWGIDQGWWAFFALVATVFRLALVMVAAGILALVAPGWIRRIQQTAAHAPVAAGFAGVAMEIAFLPVLAIAVVGLIITIIGIPLLVLLPFALFAAAVVWLAGFAAVAAQIGSGLRGRTAGHGSAALDTAFGVVLLGLVTVMGHVLAMGPWPFMPFASAFVTAGAIIEYIAWTVGLGAALLAPFRAPSPTTPPPIPAGAHSTATA